MRITGLASGLDMDEIVKNSMKPYRIKIEKQTQNKEILEIRQRLYREVIKDSRELYNKYFDVTKSDSLLLSKNWSSVKFKSSDENVLTVTGSGDAKAENYTITGTIAKAASASLELNKVQGNKVVINGREFTLKGDTNREKANDLSNQLKEAKINVTVRYSEFVESSNENPGGFIFESTLLGKDNTFVLGGVSIPIVNKTDYIAATSAIIGKVNIDELDLNSNNITFNLKDSDGSNIVIESDKLKSEDGSINRDKVIEEINKALEGHNIEALIEDNNLLFKSTELGEIVNPNLEINGDKVSEIETEDGIVDIFKNGSNEEKATKTIKLTGDEKIILNGLVVDLSLREKTEDGRYNEDITTYLNKVLDNKGLSIVVNSEDNGMYKFTSNNQGEKAVVNIGVTSGDVEPVTDGKDGEITFKDSGKREYKYSGISNTVTIDGVTFNFKEDIPSVGINIKGKQDVTEVKDKLVKFINDYNTLVEKLNKLTTEKRNRSFNPLTADQKKEMSEDEIKLWNEKVEKGQLSRDTDVSRISNSLKQAMRTIVDGTGLNLEKIGISPVADYQGTKNGTFTIDETKLTKALEEKPQEIMDMFIKSAPKDDTLSEGQKYSKTGIMNRIKDVLYKETITVSSSLLKKAGIEGSSTSYNNEITRSIEKYEKKMADMEKDFSRREQALYTKYSNLETIMNKYNSQQSYLAQQLGLS